MEKFLDDLSDFIINRLEKSRLRVEKTKKFRDKYDKFNILYGELTEFLEQTDIEKLNEFKSLLIITNDLNDLYDNATYRSGFVDGINMIYSIYPELKDESKKD